MSDEMYDGNYSPVASEATGGNPLPPHVHALMAEDQAEILRMRGQVEMLQHGFRCGGQCSCLSHCPAHEDQPECDPPCCFAAAVRQRDAALAEQVALRARIEVVRRQARERGNSIALAWLDEIDSAPLEGEGERRVCRASDAPHQHYPAPAPLEGEGT